MCRRLWHAYGSRAGAAGVAVRFQGMVEGFPEFLNAVGERARRAGVFGSVAVSNATLVCAAKDSAEPADYRVSEDAGKVWVSFTTPNRWLSESIESDLMHTGDSIEDLIDEELAELSYTGPALGHCQHFRDDQKLFTFRSVIPIPTGAGPHPDEASVGVASTCLLAYEACFRRLGDVGGAAEE
jgi:hypothetical protein